MQFTCLAPLPDKTAAAAFANAVIEYLAKSTSIKLRRVLPNNPTANGYADHTVHKSKSALRKMALAATTEWDFHL
ncbi:hypothetical protein H4S08_004441 [Coemansia sp. RSA 1365]|nr:hypothetical protein H4S08_004441 [Coemansia sp. RSA 1365]